MNNVLRWKTRVDGAQSGRPVRRLAGTEEPGVRLARILSMDPTLLANGICVILQSGVAILLSATSDGGAVSVTAYVGDEKVRGYASSAEELASVLDAVRDEAEAYVYRKPSEGQKAPQQAT